MGEDFFILVEYVGFLDILWQRARVCILLAGRVGSHTMLSYNKLGSGIFPLRLEGSMFRSSLAESVCAYRVCARRWF